MEKVTQKFLKGLVKAGQAKDITHLNFDEMQEWMKAHEYRAEIAYSAGIYGCNGKLIRDKETGILFVITSRTTALFMI